MKTRSALNNAFLSVGIGSVFVGLIKAPSSYNPVANLPLLAFFILFRIKMWLDDAKYFDETDRKNMLFDLGVICAIISWCLWAAAGYTISSPQISYRLLMWSLVGLSLWIGLDAVHQGTFGPDRKTFLILNLVYILVLAFMSASGVILPFGKELLGWVLAAGTLLDFAFFGSLKHFEET